MSAPQSKNTQSKKKNRKRGVILLIVVSMLTLLVLIGVTFVLFANRSNQIASVGMRIEEFRQPQEKMFEMVVGQMLFDTAARSSLRGHSLLGDLYGTDWIAGRIQTAGSNPPAQPNDYAWGSQVVGIQFRTDPVVDLQSRLPDYYTGRVITFTSGNWTGYSTRVLQFDPGSPGDTTAAPPIPPTFPQVYVETPAGVANAVLPQINDTFIINGAPFNGAGVGYDTFTGNLDAVYADDRSTEEPAGGIVSDQTLYTVPQPRDLVSLLPHFNGYDPNFGRIYMNTQQPTTTTANMYSPVDNFIGLGGPDEAYDAPDPQNMYLAMVPANAALLNSDANPANNLMILPSYHRPELVNYWINFIVTEIFDADNPASLGWDMNNPTHQQLMWLIMAQPYGPNGRRDNAPDDPLSPNQPIVYIHMLDRIHKITRSSIFRPMPWDHPNFTGSNPAFAATVDNNGNITNAQQLFTSLINAGKQPIWDVDNDNDGVPESIWIDPGLPVVTRADGKRYKRLVSILVQDLDGRIDMNAHGNLSQVFSITNPNGTFYPFRTSEPVSNLWTPPGSWGLAGTAPGNRLPRGMGFGPAEVDFLYPLVVNPATAPTANEYTLYRALLQSRYESRWPGDIGATAAPGQFNVRDEYLAIKQHGVANDYANVLSWYASPPDVWGRAAVMLDYGGQPLNVLSGVPMPALNVTSELQDNPYEIALVEGINSDSPYALVEIERMLRYNDNDAQNLPSRPLMIDVLHGQTYGPAERRLTLSAPGVIGADHTARQQLTGRTSHIPTPEGQIPRLARANLSSVFTKTPGNTTILDMYAAKMIAARPGFSGTPAELNLLYQDFTRIVPWEIRKGNKFDLNRWLGDGLDSTGNFTPDEPIEAFMDPGNGAPFNGARENAWQSPPAPGSFANWFAEHVNGIDVNNDGISADTPLNPPMVTVTHKALDRALARQLYARQLYCMALLFIDWTALNQQIPHDTTVTTDVDRDNLLKRRIAQWAINVVDARDHDAIMTPFEYDLEPWDGWDVDSNLMTDGRDAMAGGTPEQLFRNGSIQPVVNVNRRVVWGTERPDLLLTETFAIHARNIRDTPNDTSGLERSSPTADEDPDQLRVPQGSLFIELLCAKAGRFGGAGQTSKNKPAYPRELYSWTPGPDGQWGVAGTDDDGVNGPDDIAEAGWSGSDDLVFLDLGRIAPGGWPVWRVGIAALSNDAAATPAIQPNLKPHVMAGSNPETASFDAFVDPAIGMIEPVRGVDVRNETNPATTNFVPLDRFVWFTDPASATAISGGPLHNYSFYSNNNVNPRVEPGQYAIVAPRAITYIGSRDPAQSTQTMPPVTPGSLWGGWSPQRLVITGNGLEVYDTTVENGTLLTPAVGTVIRNAVPIIADIAGATPVTGGGTPWTAPVPWNIGLNITEPLPALPTGDYYPEPQLPMAPPAGYPVDAYDDLDAPTGTLPDVPVDNSRLIGNLGTGGQEMLATKTYTDVSSLYLQRLANPSMPFHALENPYLTVDWSSVDVSVFAGDENTNRQVGTTMVDVDPEDPFVGAAGRPMNWETRQRGSAAAALTPPYNANPWRPMTALIGPQRNVNAAAGQLYFDLSLLDNAAVPPASPNKETLSYLNSPLGQPQAAPYLGEPGPTPFPWLVHQNRPFMSPFELLQVPSSSPNRLCFEFTPGESLMASPTPSVVANMYHDPTETRTFRSPFAHLLNLFHTDEDGVDSPQLARLLDYIEVPSPYSGTERWFNPQWYGAAGFYRPPFNKISRFRDPGRININTIFDPQIWASAMGQFPGMDTADFADKVFRSRQGYGVPPNAMAGTPSGLWQMDAAYPTFFGNPYRPLDAADLMPNIPLNSYSMRKDGLGTVPHDPSPPQPPPPALVPPRGMPIEATFLRPDLDSIAPNAGTPPMNPPFPLFDNQVVNTYDDARRNAYFRYQRLQKLGNTFTTHSNVFAVWMTIGYFEVEDNFMVGVPPPNNRLIDATHPDGLRLGQEIGADSGEIVRHRAFYIIDRSIPVGHRPGFKLNSENCILLRRMIE